MRLSPAPAVDILQNLIEQLELDTSLLQPDRLRERVDALDRLETLLYTNEPVNGLQQRAEHLRDAFEAHNATLYAAIRDDIRSGIGAERLRSLIRAGDNGATDCAAGESYDYLDELVSGVLQLAPPEATEARLTRDMVRYQPTPARHIFDLIARTGLGENDVLVDLGSGLGHVPLLVSICTRARASGIEIEPAYVECAQRCARSLGLERTTFLHDDARCADLSTGTVFYLYTPFKGAILRGVLDALREEADRRTIRVCAFGPCVPAIASEAWLDAIGIAATDRLSVFRSRQRD